MMFPSDGNIKQESLYLARYNEIGLTELRNWLSGEAGIALPELFRRHFCFEAKGGIERGEAVETHGEGDVGDAALVGVGGAEGLFGRLDAVSVYKPLEVNVMVFVDGARELVAPAAQALGEFIEREIGIVIGFRISEKLVEALEDNGIGDFVTRVVLGSRGGLRLGSDGGRGGRWDGGRDRPAEGLPGDRAEVHHEYEAYQDEEAALHVRAGKTDDAAGD